MRTRLLRSATSLLAATALLALLAGCAGELATPGEALRLLGTDLPDAVVAEPYQAQLYAVGGLRPYDFSLASGSLPPGIELRGGELRGTPSATGAYEFTIEVTDANLSSTSNTYGLAVITPPEPALVLQLPETELRSEATIRARVADARGLVGIRTELTWDPQRFSLREGSVAASRDRLALLHEAEAGRLRVDAVLLGTTLTGDAELFSFVLVPVEVPATLSVGSTTEFASRAGEGFRREFATEGSVGGAGEESTPPQGAGEGTESGDETEEPADEPEAPTDEPDAPAEEPDAPAEEPDAPAEEPEVPADEPGAPADEPDAPVDEPEVPADEPTEPAPPDPEDEP